MDAIFMSSSSAERSFSPWKQLNKIPKRNSTAANFFSKPSENLAAPTSFIHSGAYLPSAFLLNPIFYQNNQQLLQQQQQSPVLRPPVPSKPMRSSLPYRTRSLSSSPSNKKNNGTLTPKRSKSKQFTVKVEEDQRKKDNHLKPKEATKTTQAISKSFVMTSANPNNPPEVLASSYLATGNVNAKDLEKFSSFVFALSPPPSSLPLPKFSLRPKNSCNAEVAEIDPGATDNLRRLLRLR